MKKIQTFIVKRKGNFCEHQDNLPQFATSLTSYKLNKLGLGKLEVLMVVKSHIQVF
jgi:hypothetical protein